MHTEIEDLRRVVKAAKKLGGKVAIGGHSLGGSITSAYATWDSAASRAPRPVRPRLHRRGQQPGTGHAEAARRRSRRSTSTPWLTFGGIPAPLGGLFNTSGSLSVLTAPNETSIG